MVGGHRFPNGTALGAPHSRREVDRQEERIMHLSAGVFKGNLGSRASPGLSFCYRSQHEASCYLQILPEGPQAACRSECPRASETAAAPAQRLFPTRRFTEESARDTCHL